MQSRDVGAVIVAAGAGSRFGGRKQFLLLGGKPLLLWSFETIVAADHVREVVAVAPRDEVAAVEELVGGRERRLAPPEGALVRVVAGGERRQDSVLAGLRALSPACRWALVHDAARPLLRAEEARRFIGVLREKGAAVIGHRSSDSVKEEREGAVSRSLPRETIWLVQTPQGAETTRLVEALEIAHERRLTVTDETSALELVGIRAVLVDGSRENIKITYPDDLAVAEHLLERRGRERGGC